MSDSPQKIQDSHIIHRIEFEPSANSDGETGTLTVEITYTSLDNDFNGKRVHAIRTYNEFPTHLYEKWGNDSYSTLRYFFDIETKWEYEEEKI
ncbi:hypothetical protein [Nitratidesulfovibrio sp.]|uniref:hypothetical protein n=1 Tax=Nitratidesulfovibrio sp. TaxID=2802297 RepID=UPI003341BAE2